MNALARLPDWLWAPLAGGVLVLITGMLGLWAHQPWLFPSLGPTIFLQVLEPQQPSSRPYHIVVGHAIGVGAAVLAVLVCAAESTPPVLIAHLLSGERVVASALAVSLMLLGQVLLKAAHPPAAATVLLITLGAFKLTWWDMAVLAVGILLTAALGEMARRVRQGGEGITSRS